MENNDNNKKTKGIAIGLLIFFGLLIPYFGLFLILIAIIAYAKKVKNKEVDLEKDDISQEEIHAHDFLEVQKYDVTQQQVHAHDFTQVQEDDVTQEQVHAHDAWEDDGPIKYYK